MKGKDALIQKIKTNIVPNVYFTPPENTKITYPACIVSREDYNVKRANNSGYIANMGYKLLFISSSSDEEIFDKISKCFTYWDFRIEYKNSGLYHKVFVVYE